MAGGRAVGAHRGIYHPFAADYLTQWGNTPADLMAELEVVRQTAARIIDALSRTVAIAEHTAAGVTEPRMEAHHPDVALG